MPYNCDPGVDLPASQDFSNKTLLDEIYKANQQIADNCNAQNPELGTLIGTVADARDVRAIAQAVGVGDKLIRYWGKFLGSSQRLDANRKASHTALFSATQLPDSFLTKLLEWYLMEISTRMTIGFNCKSGLLNWR